MGAFQIQDTVGDVVTRWPALSRVFEQSGIDYCCGGKKTLSEACQSKGLDPQSLLTALEASASKPQAQPAVHPMSMTLTMLVGHIAKTHHTYLYSELPRLDRMIKKVAAVHGRTDARLYRVRKTFLELAQELVIHMAKEERMLFPMVRQLESARITPGLYCGSFVSPIRQMESEHTQTGAALEKLKELTDAYTPPKWACNTYRAMLDGLADLERDIHQHIHKENNILFPRILKMEQDQANL